MRYLMLLSGTNPATPPPPELFEAIMKLGGEATQAGVMLDTAGLLPSAAGARVTLSEGQLTVTDGPFTESKEVLGGYWMIDVPSRQAAIEWASKCPASENEIIEIRQVQEMSDFSEELQQVAAGFTEMQNKAAQR